MMKVLSALAMVVGLMGTVVSTSYAADEKKCDKAGKDCKDGADCKVENCKKAPAPAPK